MKIFLHRKTLREIHRLIRVQIIQTSTLDYKALRLIYYGQVWSYAYQGKPLVNDQFELWKTGPIPKRIFEIASSKIDKNGYLKPRNGIVKIDNKVLDSVVDVYGRMSFSQLYDLWTEEFFLLKNERLDSNSEIEISSIAKRYSKDIKNELIHKRFTY